MALYWHFNRLGVVSAMVLRQLARYRDAGFAVVFISMAPIFATLRAAGDGVCRMTESAQGGHHMRSCFVLARGQKAVAALAAEPDACPGRCLVRRLGFPFVKPTPLRRHPVGLPGEEASTIRSCLPQAVPVAETSQDLQDASGRRSLSRTALAAVRLP